MRDTFYIAWKYIQYNKAKTFTLIACITIILYLPIGLDLLLNESEKQLMSRAEASPLLIGAKGSALDLCMNSLYFDDEIPDFITLEAAREIDETGLGKSVPMYVRFKAREFPIIGTTLDYFENRNLTIAQGRTIALLGECVIGSSVAEKLELKVGDGIVSSPESLFDIAGVYPLKMKIVGIMEDSHTSDDLAIFADLKTSWIIEGLGHGHQDVTKLTDPTLIYDRNDSVVAATSKLMQYNEITENNIESFHFHGSLDNYPITSVLVFPKDEKSEALLRGRYIGQEVQYQMLKPTEVIDGLLQNIFRIRNVLDAVIAIVAVATLLAMILVFALSLRLRAREIQTIFKLGCRKGAIARFLTAEIAIILTSSALICFVLIFTFSQFNSQLVRILFMG